MKPFFIFLFLITSFSFSTQAQLNKGVWLVGGTGFFYSFKEEIGPTGSVQEAKYTAFEIFPSVGYFFADKFAAGIKPGFTSIKGKVTSLGGGQTNVQRYWIGPFARYYFLNKEAPNNLVADVSYQTGFFGGGLAKGKLETFSALAGPVIFFNTSVGMEVLLGYRYRKEDVDGGSKIIDKGFRVSIGFQIHLEN